MKRTLFVRRHLPTCHASLPQMRSDYLPLLTVSGTIGPPRWWVFYEEKFHPRDATDNKFPSARCDRQQATDGKCLLIRTYSASRICKNNSEVRLEVHPIYAKQIQIIDALTRSWILGQSMHGKLSQWSPLHVVKLTDVAQEKSQWRGSSKLRWWPEKSTQKDTETPISEPACSKWP